MPLASNARSVVRSVRGRIAPPDHTGADRGTQLVLAREWARLAQAGEFLPLRDVEFRNHSQNGEDGILLYLFTLAGHGSRRAIEMCAGDGIENNSTNLVLHHDWDALMLDGDDALLERGRAFYAKHPDTYRVGPALVTEWITAENINDILSRHGYQSDIDLLSLDMDGIDYWILREITLRPRVVVLEFNNRVPADIAVTVPNDPSFVAAGGAWAGDGFFGASLAAFEKLMSGRGYRLVGANRPNTNAFFLREDVLPEMQAVSVADCQSSRWAKHQSAHWDSVADRPWVSV